MPKPKLTLAAFKSEAQRFVRLHAAVTDKTLYGVTDGKAVGTFIEKRFHKFLKESFDHRPGSSSRGRDLPDINVDLKVTSVRQPQSSCPYKSAAQKIFGLGYSLLVLVYDKSDDDDRNEGTLRIMQAVFIDQSRTADFQTTIGLRNLIDHNANVDDIVAFFEDRRLPVDDVSGRALAERVLANPPEIGYLTISNALQWRLQYGRVVDQAGNVEGVEDLSAQAIAVGELPTESSSGSDSDEN